MECEATFVSHIENDPNFDQGIFIAGPMKLIQVVKLKDDNATCMVIIAIIHLKSCRKGSPRVLLMRLIHNNELILVDITHVQEVLGDCNGTLLDMEPGSHLELKLPAVFKVCTSITPVVTVEDSPVKRSSPRTLESVEDSPPVKTLFLFHF
jgi:hypothetical protein